MAPRVREVREAAVVIDRTSGVVAVQLSLDVRRSLAEADRYNDTRDEVPDLVARALRAAADQLAAGSSELRPGEIVW